MKNKYNKTTEGLSAQVFVTKALAYSTQATYDLFVANALDGEMGVFITYKASGPTIYKENVAIINPSGTALTAFDKFFIAQKIDGLVKRTQTFTYNEFKVRQEAYVAPVKQVSVVGYDGVTAGSSMNSGTLVVGQIFPIRIQETTPANQPYPTWSYEVVSKIGDTLTSVGARLIKQINDSLGAQNQYNGQMVFAELLTDGTFTVNTVTGGNVGVTNGSTTVTATGNNVVAGSYVRIGGTTGAFGVYKVASVTANAFELDSPYQGTTNAALAIANLGTMSVVTVFGIKLTALTFGSHFRVIVNEDLVSASVTYVTPFKEGVGYSDSVAQLEDEGQIFAGHTTGNIAFDADYGKPTSYTVNGTTYQFIYLVYYRVQPSAAPPKVADSHFGNVIIATPVGVAPTTALTGMFV